MSLLDEIRDWYKEEDSPPFDKALGSDVEQVHSEDLNELRWGIAFMNVYKQGEEYVAVEGVRPATELQDWGDYGKPEIYEVTPQTKTITVTEYVRN